MLRRDLPGRMTPLFTVLQGRQRVAMTILLGRCLNASDAAWEPLAAAGAMSRRVVVKRAAAIRMLRSGYAVPNSANGGEVGSFRN